MAGERAKVAMQHQKFDPETKKLRMVQWCPKFLLRKIIH